MRDSHGVAQVRFVTGNKILRILKAKGLAPDLPEDLYHLIKKAVNIRKHMERNRKVLHRKKIVWIAGHSTHFQVGSNNSKVEGGILQNKAVFYFHSDIFIFEVAEKKMQLDRQFARCPAAVECPG